jgi:hypothetical protein
MQEFENVINPVVPEVPKPKREARIKRNKLLPVAEQVVHAYTTVGKTMHEIADFFNCSDGTVRNLLIIKGVDLRPRGRRKKARPTKSLGE